MVIIAIDMFVVLVNDVLAITNTYTIHNYYLL